MRIILKDPGGIEYRLDLPGATRDDVDLLSSWLAHIFALGMHDGSLLPARFMMEVW